MNCQESFDNTHGCPISSFIALQSGQNKINKQSEGKPHFPCREPGQRNVVSKDQPYICEVISGPQEGGLKAVIPQPQRINQSMDLTELNFSEQGHIQAGIFK